MLQIAGAVFAIVAVVSLTVALSGSGSAPRYVTAPSSTPTASVSGASLRYPTQVTVFLGSAASDIAAVTTYDYRRLDEALTAGLAVTTGSYRAAYRAALTGDLARTATAEHVVHIFELLDIGIGRMSPDGSQATVLVFGRQRITDDRTGPDTEVQPVTLTATIQHRGNRYLISDLADGTDPGLPPAGPDLPAAATAARTEVVNLLSYRRSDFAVDLDRALAGATSPLRETVQSKAPDTRAAMQDGKYDTTGSVTSMAVVRADADTATFLVAADESRTVDGADAPTVVHHRYEVTITRTGDAWAASRVASVEGDD